MDKSGINTTPNNVEKIKSEGIESGTSENTEGNSGECSFEVESSEDDFQVKLESSDINSDNKADQQPPLDILADRPIKVDQKFVLKFTKEGKNVKKEAKESCKVLHFSSEWTVDEVLAELAALNPKEYPNLFIFIIEAKSFAFPGTGSEKVEEMKENLFKFGTSRPLVLQLTSADENATKFYYKEETSTQFLSIDQQETNFEELKDFPTFLRSFLDGRDDSFEYDMLEMLPQLKNYSIILRFLRTLHLSDGFFGSMILEVSKKGTKSEFLAALDASFECNGRNVGIRAQKYLSDAFNDDDGESEVSSESDQHHPEEETAADEVSSGNPEDEEDSSSATSSESNISDFSSSVLHTAVENGNKEVIDYLITYWTHLIQQLPFKHQIRISTAAFESNQLDVLCDFLQISDFPFPSNFKKDQIKDERLHKIFNERTEFGMSIKEENFEKIDEFINNNAGLKVVYNPVNKSALKQAVDLKKFKVYYYLMSHGFIATEFNDLKEVLSGKELKEANKFKIQQRRKNVNEALRDELNSILLLLTRSSIHNRKISKEQEAKYRDKIRKWFEDINKIKFGPEFLKVAASCEKLKIIFDFESDTVEKASLEGPNAAGSMYPTAKWIFVGAKLSDGKREQVIKGVLAHELCHYVMRLVYENQENPYYKHMLDMAEMFEEIVKAIDKWSTKSAESPDDECNRIISSVFELYSKDEFHLELIVRVVQILVEFDDDEEKLKSLEEIYKILFDFWELQVIPELQKFNLKEREDVRKMNRIFELLPSIKSEKIEFCASKDIKALTDNKLVIVTSNVPKLLLINIHKHLQDELGDLIDTKNVFVDPQKLKNQEILRDFTKMLSECPKLNIFVDCSKTVPQNLNKITVREDTKLIVIVLDENQHEEIEKILKSSGERTVEKEVVHNWKDLSEESKKLLLETKINFQNSSQFLLMDLLRKKVYPDEPLESRTAEEHEKQILNDSNEIIDDNLLKLLVEKSEIQINQQARKSVDEKHFRVLFQARDLIKEFKPKNIKNLAPGRATRELLLALTYNEEFLEVSSSSNAKEQDMRLEMIKPKFEGIEKIGKITQDVLLKDVSNQKFVLISDKAGSGKTWIVKNVTNMLREKYPTHWVTYVDLKTFIQIFVKNSSELDFATFMLKKVLKPKERYEEKLFRNLYKNGKVFILFDGFDEIAPNCAQFVSNLAKTFEFNGGNQLWIATRDYFEVDLKEKLQLDAVYKLDEFTEENGIELVASSWILGEIEDEGKIQNESDILARIKSSPNYQNYKEIARKLTTKVTKFQSQSIGFPQFYKMIANVCKDDQDDSIDFTLLKLFKECVNMQYERWSREKGELRAKANTESQHKDVNYHKLHQIIAMESLFPDESKFCDLELKNLDWTDEEIIACGLLSKKGDKFYFSHETFREFYAAEFMIRILTNKEVDDKFCEYLIKFLKTPKFEVIRMFLNEAFGEESIMKKIESKIPKIAEYFCKNPKKVENLSQIFGENLENLGDFLIKIFRNVNYKEMKAILYKNKDIIASAAKYSKLFIKFQDFLINFLNENDFKNFILKNQIFLTIFGSDLDIDMIEGFIDKICCKTDQNFIEKTLKAKDQDKENLIFNAILSQTANATKFQGIFKILSKYFSLNEIINLIKACNVYGDNILHVCAYLKQEEKLKFVWKEIKQIFASQKKAQQFKQLLFKMSKIYNQNPLQTAGFCHALKFHQTLWGLLLETFENRCELKDLIMQKDKKGNNFIHYVIRYTNLEVVEFTFKILKEIFYDDQYDEILNSKGHLGRNLLQLAASYTKDIKIHEFLWKVFRDFFKSDEKFVDFLKTCDNYNENVFHVAARFATSEVFEFIIQQIEEFAIRDEIKNILATTGKFKSNMLQIASGSNKSLEFHENFWKIIRKYFNSSEIVDMIMYTDTDGFNLITCVFAYNKLEIIEFTWNEIKKYIPTKEDQANYLRNSGDGLFSLRLLSDSPDSVEIKWIKKVLKEYNLNIISKFTYFILCLIFLIGIFYPFYSTYIISRKNK